MIFCFAFCPNEVKITQSCLTLCDPLDYTVHEFLQARILEWVSHSLLQGIFPAQGLNPGLLHCRHILYQLSHQGSPSLCFVLLLYCRSSLYILEINPLSELWFVIVFSHSVGCLFAIVSFAVQKSFKFNQVLLVYFCFYFHYSRR